MMKKNAGNKPRPAGAETNGERCRREGGRLTPPQRRRAYALIARECCHYDEGHCLRLDDGEPHACPQMLSFSLLCPWFRSAVLPIDKGLWDMLYSIE